MRKNSRFALASAATLLMAGLALGSPGAMAASRTDVPQGVASAATTDATVFGNTPANTPVTVSIVLRTRHASELASYIQGTVTPGSLQYRQYLSTREFAARFGQNPAVIDEIVQYFAGYGITASVYPDNLDITLHGTAGQFDQAFNIQLQNMESHHQYFHGPDRQPNMPTNLTGPILAVMGLTNYAPFSSTAVHAPPSALANLPSQDTSGTATTPPHGWMDTQKLEQRYDVTPLVQSGDLGQGQTLGIVTLASVNPADAYTFWKAYNIPVSNPNRISLVNVDGGAGPVSVSSGSGETTLDVEQSGALAPDANIIVYQAPNTDYGFVDAFFNAISANQAGSLSVSWGLSETAVNWSIQNGYESPNYAQAFDEAYQEAAAQGISSFGATGDYGAYQAVSDLGTTNLSVGSPADSPYITAAGGTTLPSSMSPLLQSMGVNIPQERAWAWDWRFSLWQGQAPSEAAWAEENIVGSNGGYSTIFPEPGYQEGVSGVSQFSAVPWFTPIENDTAFSFNPNPQVITGKSNGGRAMPDLSMDADPFTGYAIYSQSLYGGWTVGWGGTSFVAPQLNGITALINEAVGTRVGFWNPQIYRFAQQANSPLNPLDTSGTSNDNLYYTGTPGTIYNPATGLGTPDVAALAQDFASNNP